MTVRRKDKPLAWLHGEVKTPPFGPDARIEVGYLLRRLQSGESIGQPASKPMLSIGTRCHELRVNDRAVTWRIIYRIDSDAIVIAEVFPKKTRTTPQRVIDTCRRRFREYDNASK